MKKEVLFVFLGIFVLAISMIVLAKPNVPNSVVPAHAVQVSEGVFSLGQARDVDGRIVQGFMFIHDNRGGNAKPGTECGNGICEPGEKKSCATDCGGGNGDDTESSSCFSLFAKGARWKTTEPYVTDTGVNPAVTETSLNEWDSEIPSFNIFGTGSSGTTDGADAISPDGKNEVEFQNLGATNTIAYTIVWGFFSGPPPFRELVEWDAVFNSNYPWSLNGEAGKMDYQNIATHEFGHSLGLGHPADRCTEETMYAFASSGETKKRSLEAGDIVGVNNLY